MTSQQQNLLNTTYACRVFRSSKESRKHIGTCHHCQTVLHCGSVFFRNPNPFYTCALFWGHFRACIVQKYPTVSKAVAQIVVRLFVHQLRAVLDVFKYSTVTVFRCACITKLALNTVSCAQKSSQDWFTTRCKSALLRKFYSFVHQLRAPTREYFLDIFRCSALKCACCRAHSKCDFASVGTRCRSRFWTLNVSQPRRMFTETTCLAEVMVCASVEPCTQVRLNVNPLKCTRQEVTHDVCLVHYFPRDGLLLMPNQLFSRYILYWQTCFSQKGLSRVAP